MKQQMLFGLLALIMVIALVGSASAYGAKFFGGDPESHEKIAGAIEARDYNAWKEAMSAQLTEEMFNMHVEKYEANSERLAQREAMEQAVEEGDYEAWKAAVKDCFITSDMIVDEDEFKILVQLHQAREDGDYETVQELRGQLCLPMPNRFPKHIMFGHLEE